MPENKKELQDLIIMHRRNLHQIPELGLELPQTVSYVTKVLDSLDIKYKVYEDISCIVAVIEGEGEGRTLAIRADMDALPVKEETELPFRSLNGKMHACGHDGHTAILLGVAKYLKEHSTDFSGRVKLLFQAGEEYPGGAQPMIERGVLQDPKVDAVIGLHQGCIHPDVPKGSVGISYGALMASVDCFLIKVIGKGAHGAYPQDSVDAISIAAELVTALDRIVSREVPAVEAAVLSICRIEGGSNHNILPEVVELEGTVRTTDPKIREKIARRMNEIANGIAIASGAKIEVLYDPKYPATINDPQFTAFFEKVAVDVVGRDKVVVLTKPVMSSEDMSFFLNEVPGTFFFLSNPKDGEDPVSHHNPKFDIEEDLMMTGCMLFVKTVLEYLKKEE